MLALRSKKLVAAALGIVLAVTPVYWFISWLQRQGETEVSVAAHWSIGFIDLTIDQVVARLEDLANRGLDSCTPANVETMHQSVFASGPIKELALVSPGGQTLCSDIGSSFEPRDILASAATSNRDVMLDVVRLVGRDDNLLRVRRVAPQRKPALAALLPVDLLLPRIAPDGGRLPGYARMTLTDGTLVGASADQTGSVPWKDYISAQARSERYGPIATVTMQRRGTIAS